MKKITEIIKYEGDNSTFIWKHPCEDFNTLTQLIVHESQEAIFFLNGQALDVFGAGRYTLETQNIPKLGRYLNRSTGGVTPFHCEVYFINKSVQMAIKWGTEAGIRFIEPILGVPLQIEGACGRMNLEVADSRALLVKLVGNMSGIAWDKETVEVDEKGYEVEVGKKGVKELPLAQTLQKSFRPIISNAVRTHLAGAIRDKNINVLEIDANLEVLSEALRKRIAPTFKEYGLNIPQFYVNNILLPEEDELFKKLRFIHTTSLRVQEQQSEALVAAAERKLIIEEQANLTEEEKGMAERKIIGVQAERAKGIAEADVMTAKGYTQRDVLAAEVQKAYAKGISEMEIEGGAGGSMTSDMLGLGVGLAAAGAIAPRFGEMFKGIAPIVPMEIGSTKCAKCGAVLSANAKFCNECGEKVGTVNVDTVVCPSCGKSVEKSNFCRECGYKFVTVCPKCGKDVQAGAKFCFECGEKL